MTLERQHMAQMAVGTCVAVGRWADQWTGTVEPHFLGRTLYEVQNG